ncbi:putative siderophore biosynthesis protein [Cladophialophora carrionii]|uniref:Putative siderophore biosynthesis protein n=1 Tax=Cladophialophora carrionii TaxID=86049 RepID=A0A1C1CI67_9EURO|nr:putative siderophore biosynthesis protein [Cladophialophora carrionii]
MVQQVYLPNGQIYTVTPVFGGFTFKSTNLDLHHSAMPPGWTVILQTEDQVEDDQERRKSRAEGDSHRGLEETGHKHTVTHRFTKPTVQSDSMFISSISMPSSTDFKNTASPTRHIAMMLWATLCWYFHKEPPNLHALTDASALTPEPGRPKLDWRIKIKREGIFKGKNTLQKLERMGLIASEDSSVGTDTDTRLPSGWADTFVSRRSFWQIDARIFLFTMAPQSQSPFPQASPYPSRPSSPDRNATVATTDRGSPRPADYVTTSGIGDSFTAGISSPGGPFNSGSHLPTFYPPHPTQFTFTNHIRHPIRPKPPRQGETFYSRYIPSVGQWLSFRVPTLSPKPCPHPQFVPSSASMPAVMPSHGGGASIATLPTMDNFLDRPSDLDLLHKWMNDPRVNAAWGVAGPQSTQHKFLVDSLESRHSFPVYGCWDGKPFGYFEIYWVKEDKLGRMLGGEVGNYTRGLHVLIGENEFRGAYRVKVWLSALVHYCFLADSRTETVMLEPRIDNTKFIGYLKDAGFYKQGEVTFPHKQSAVMKIDRESWEAPEL